MVDLYDLPYVFSDGVSVRLPLKGLPALSTTTKSAWVDLCDLPYLFSD